MGIEGAVKRVLSEAALGLYLPGRSPTTRFWSRFRFAVTLRSVGASVLLAETLWAGEHQINMLSQAFSPGTFQAPFRWRASVPRPDLCRSRRNGAS
jgi:hypothetical protein